MDALAKKIMQAILYTKSKHWEYEQEILNIIKGYKKNIKVFKAIKSNTKFELNFNEIKL